MNNKDACVQRKRLNVYLVGSIFAVHSFQWAVVRVANVNEHIQMVSEIVCWHRQRQEWFIPLADERGVCR